MLNASPHQILYRIFPPSNNASSKVQLKKPRIEYVKIPYSAILVYQLLKNAFSSDYISQLFARTTFIQPRNRVPMPRPQSSKAHRS